jgi:predicted dehydrogenase
MTVRIGFCGTGGIAAEHLKNLQTLENAQLAGLYDAAPGRAEQAREMLAAQDSAAGKTPPSIYPGLREMIADAGLDALYVCLPPFVHGETELTALDAGLALYVEKPVALGIDVARQVAQAVRQAGVVSAVGYQLRYLPSVHRARALLAGQPIGMLIGLYLAGLPGPGHWWRIMSQSGGQVVEQATHTVDMMRFLAGEVTSVYARYARHVLRDEPQMDIPDVSALTLEFANGAIGNLSASCLLGWGMTRDLHGVRVVAHQLLVHVAGAGSGTARYPDGRVETLADDNVSAMLLADSAFVEAVATHDQSRVLSSYEDGLRSAAVTWAANESARTGQPVTVVTD